MSDPKHPLKVVIVLSKGLISGIYLDRSEGSNIKFLIADYDTESGPTENLGVDMNGEERYLYENAAWLDTAMVRAIINKRGNPIHRAKEVKGADV